MGQTKLTAHLPTVDVEITRHEFPEQNAQALTIHIIATPSFDDAAQWLLRTGLFSIASPFSIWADFMQVWQRAWFPGWQPWLSIDSPPVRSLKEPEYSLRDCAGSANTPRTSGRTTGSHY